MLTLTQRWPANAEREVHLTLALTAEERTRSRHQFTTPEGQPLYLYLPRGTVLGDGDLLENDTRDTLVRVVAKPEPVMTVTATDPFELLRAAYHLGNRHIPLEINATYLRLSPDSVLRSLLEKMGLQVEDAILPFYPEGGAYSHPH